MNSPNIKSHFRESISFKMLIIGIIVFVLMIPSMMVQSLVSERMHRKNSVLNEITSAWSNPQTITGPIISLPYNEYYTVINKDKADEVKYRVKTAYILPETLNVNGDLVPEIRYRSIYKAVVYNADLDINGKFDFSVLKSLRIDPKNLRLNEAQLILGIKDMRGITDEISLNIGLVKKQFEPGHSNSLMGSSSDSIDAVVESASKYARKSSSLNPGSDLGFGANVISPITITNLHKKIDFSVKLSLNGSKNISIVPVGKTTQTKLKAAWGTPSFFGAFLPDERNITEESFDASWKVLHLNRPFPQAWTGAQPELQGSIFGVKLLMANDKYQRVMRTAKYALMFIVFTFLAFFISEVINKNRVHPVQYLFVGMGLIVFYSLLLAFSEHINFNKAYWISAIATILMIFAYSRSVLKKDKLALMVGAVLIVLYIYLFVLLQMQDFALLMGSIGLFIVLGGVMYLTRNIDWYSQNESSQIDSESTQENIKF